MNRYVEALRERGYADLAIDYLKMRLERVPAESPERAELEFEIASSLIAASESIDDLSQREQMLEEARAKFEEFTKTYPDHPRRPESLVQVAGVDLQKGLLSVLQAQLPANASRAVALAKEARGYLTNAADDYEKAYKQAHDAYKAMPIFVAEDDREGREKKSRLFAQYIEAQFQAALARFYLADSYRAIDLPPVDPNDAPAVAARAKEKAEWDAAYQKTLEQARKGFFDIHDNHRREPAGLFAHLWLARCLAAQGQHRQAMGIFQQLMEHENRDLENFQRQVFHFKTISHAARKEYSQVINLATPWLRVNSRYRSEPAYQGVQMELALALIAEAEVKKDEREKHALIADADSVLERLATTMNQFTGVARREQLRIAPYLTGNREGRTFNQLFSLANAKLDLLKPDLPPEKRKELLEETKRLFRQAIAAARDSDSADSVHDARLALAFVHLQAEEVYEAAVLCEHLARRYPKATAAPQAAALGVTAYAWGFDQAIQLQDQNVAAHAEVDADHLRALTEYLVGRWPGTKEADEALATMGRLELARGNHVQATEAFDRVSPKSPKYPESVSLAGGASWDAYKAAIRAGGAAPEALTALKDTARDHLARASVLLHQGSVGTLDRQTFLNDALWGEVEYEAGQDAKALEILLPLVDAVQKGSVSSEVEPVLKIGVLTTALQCHVRQGELEKTDALMDLIGKQQGQDQSGNVTVVFVALASRLREQMARVKATGDSARIQATADSFEKFLDRVSQREAGQTVQSLVYLADNLLELERFEKAIGLLQRALAHPEAADADNLPNTNRARLLLARAQARVGRFAEAREGIDKLLRENMNAKDVIMERGAILEAAGDVENGIKHYKWVVNRMKAGSPRPPEFYEAVDRLITLLLKVQGTDRPKRLGEGQYLANFLLNTDTQLPGEWRPVFERHAHALAAALKR